MEHIIKTDIGVVRVENQDRAAVFNKKGITLGILCDGMGGHKGGSFASAITIDTFEKEFNKSFPFGNIDNIDKWFLKTIKESKKNMTFFAKGDVGLLDMGTTVTAAIVIDGDIKIYNIGDSRTYIYNGLLHQITKDHNLRNYYIENYNYSVEKAATVRGATALTSALGPKKKVKIDNYKLPIEPETKFVVLTSDGIHDYISKPLFDKIISSKKPLEKKSINLIKEAIKGKSADNLTVVILGLE
ncbi:MAG: serine/threonine-protein phosphatase [Mycoplasmataceae bacterium]|nr:serine/threonine-protein phosphatase [Mycoplasmataceae bacterium]